MTTPVYEAFLRAQLEIIHEEVAKLWKISKQASYMPSHLRKQIQEIVSLLPEEYRTPDMPAAKPYRHPVKKSKDDNFEDLLG